MSNSKSAIQEIKSLMVQFGFLKSDEIELLSFKLEDDTILQTEKLESGSKIVKINEAFEQVSLEDGSYKLKENFEIEVAEGEIKSVKEIFIDAKLADGTVVKVEGDTLLEGAKVVVITEDAEIPAPDGVHELEDGSKIETKDGIIVKVEEAMVEELPKEGPDAMPPAVDEPATEGKPVPDVEVELMSLLKDFIQKVSEKMGALEEKMEGVEGQFAAFKKEPSAKKIANGKTEKFNNVSSDDIDDKISMIMAMRNTNK
jgi:hypothetical protein